MLLNKVQLSSRPRQIAITPDGRWAYVTGDLNTSPTGNDVSVIDIASKSLWLVESMLGTARSPSSQVNECH